MIIQASQRGGGKQLGLHLLNAHDNEHVSVHEVRGFMSSDVVGAFKEAYAVSKATRCKQFLFSVSFNPPETEQVETSTFEKAISRVEEKNGLNGQPRVIVFHEKEGRRHAHAVWSRIDADTMTAKQMSHFKNKCMDVSREMYIEHGWQMPKGMMSAKEKDPRNFTLAEWQQSKRLGYHARDLKQEVQECWAVSDSRAAFASALEERGMKLAKGDRRGHVIVTHEGEVMSVARYAGQKTKDVRARLGDEAALKSVDETKAQFINELTQRSQSHLKEQAQKSAAALAPLNDKRQAMTAHHRQERSKLEAQQKQRTEQETRDRAAMLNKGIKGLWDRVTGTHAKTKRQNERDAYAALQRDRKQQQELIHTQLTERQQLQTKIRQHRASTTRERLAIHKQLYDLRQGKLEPDKQAQKPERQKAQHSRLRPEFAKANPPQAPPAKQAEPTRPTHPPRLKQDQLAKLRQMQTRQQTPKPKATKPRAQSSASTRLEKLRAKTQQAENEPAQPRSKASRLERLRNKAAAPKGRNGPELEC